jgi:hypothetical protein
VALLLEHRYKVALDSLKESWTASRTSSTKWCRPMSTETTADRRVQQAVLGSVHKFLAMEHQQIRLPSEFDGMPFDAATRSDRRESMPVDLDQILGIDEMSSGGAFG